MLDKAENLRKLCKIRLFSRFCSASASICCTSGRHDTISTRKSTVLPAMSRRRGFRGRWSPCQVLRTPYNVATQPLVKHLLQCHEGLFHCWIAAPATPPEQVRRPSRRMVIGGSARYAWHGPRSPGCHVGERWRGAVPDIPIARWDLPKVRAASGRRVPHAARAGNQTGPNQDLGVGWSAVPSASTGTCGHSTSGKPGSAGSALSALR